MSIALELTFIVVLVALTVGLVRLLVQLRRTAQGIDVFLLSSSKDLSQIAEDVHASRLRMDLLAAALQISLEDLSGLTGMIRDLGRAAQDLNRRYHGAIESASRTLGGIVGGISAVLTFFKRRQPPHVHE